MEAFVIDPEERIELNELDRCRLEDILKEPLDDEAIQIPTDPLDNLPLTIRKLQFTPDCPELPTPVIDFNLLIPKSEESEYEQIVEPSDPIQLLSKAQIESYKRCEKESSQKLEIIRKFKTKKLPVMNFEEITNISNELKESGLSPSCISVSNKYVLIGFNNSWVSVYTTEGTEIRKLKVGNESQIHLFGCASSVDISQDETWCVSGYEKGQVAVWDLNTGYNIRISNSIFSSPVLNAKFWKYQRQFVVFSDCKGNLASVECVKTLLTTTLDTSMIYRGELGTIISIAPLFPYAKRPHATDSHRILALGTAEQVVVVTLEPLFEKILIEKLPENVEKSEPKMSWYIEEDPMLAISWGNIVSIFQLKSAHTTGIQKIATINTQLKLKSLTWLAADTLVSIDSLKRLQICQVSSMIEGNISDGILDSIKLNEEITFQSFMKDGLAIYPLYMNTVKSTARHIFILSNHALYKGKLMNWEECLEQMMRNGDWLQALCNAIEFQTGTGKKYQDVPYNKEPLRCTLEIVAREYINTSAIPLLNKIPFILEYCVSVSLLSLLFTELFEYIIEHDSDGRNTSALLECLEPMILSDSITSIPLSILTKMVSHYSPNNLSTLERIILHLNPNSLDIRVLNGVCEEYNLFTALIYINTNSTYPNFMTPIKALYAQIMNSEKVEEKMRFSYMLLWYVGMCFDGKTFPNGSIVVSYWKEAAVKIVEWMLKENHMGVLLSFDAETSLRVVRKVFENEVPAEVLRQTIPSHSNLLDKLQEVIQPHSLSFKYLVDFISNIPSHYHKLASKPLCLSVSKFIMKPRKEDLPVLSITAPDLDSYILSFLNLSISEEYQDQLLDSNTSHLSKIILSLLYTRSDLTSENIHDLYLLAINSPYTEVLLYLQELQGKYQECYQTFLNCHNIEIKSMIFDWVNRMFNSLKSPQLEKMKKAVGDSLDILVEVDSDKTTKLVKDWYENEHAEIICKLKNAPNLQLKYLKELLKDNDELITDDLIILYIELVCSLEPIEIMSVLTSREDYPLDEALRICTSHKLTEPSAYLYERLGCTKDALDLHITSLCLKLQELERSLAEKQKLSSNLLSGITLDIYNSIELCSRNGSRLVESEAEEHWFSILDHLFEGFERCRPNFIYYPQAEPFFSKLIKPTLNEMMEHLSFNNIISHIVEKFGSVPFKHFKESFIGVLCKKSYQENILSKAINLLNYDTVNMAQNLLYLSNKGVTSNDVKCSKCEEKVIKESLLRSENSLSIFACGHIYHRKCLKDSSCEICKRQEMKKGSFFLSARGRKQNLDT